MKLLYKNNKVKTLCTNEKKAIKELGLDIANKLFKAIYVLESALNLKDILSLPQYNLHVLRGDKNGIYSMYLGKNTGYRLLLIPLDVDDNPVISVDMSIYMLTVCVEIIEVSKHYE